VNETVYQPEAAQRLYGMRPAGSSSVISYGCATDSLPPDEYKNYCLAQGQMFQTHKCHGRSEQRRNPRTAKHAGGGLSHFSG
jgi:hypothetical protein